MAKISLEQGEHRAENLDLTRQLQSKSGNLTVMRAEVIQQGLKEKNTSNSEHDYFQWK